MLRRKTLRRKANLKPRVPVKKRNGKRHAAEWRRAYGSPERVKWITTVPCLMCGSLPSQNAHLESGGMGRKADAESIIPLCERCHVFQHQHGWKALTGMSNWKDAMERAAKQVAAQWLEVSGGENEA